jgi:FKBP-type peptidyl-prolyl cis-trans isomerase SlyD
MLITAPCVVSLTWQLEDAHGQVLDTLDEPVEFFFGGDDLLEKVEEVLLDQERGFTTRVQLEPEHAFGPYDPALVCFESRAIFPEHLEVGMQFDGPPEGSATPGMPREAIYAITEIYPDHVVLDGNHPLAGMALRLALKVEDVREAGPAEIEARSVGVDALSVLAGTPPGAQRH